MRDKSSMSKYNKQVKEKHYFSDLTSSWCLHLAAVSCLLLRRQRFNKIFKLGMKGRIKQFFKSIY